MSDRQRAAVVVGIMLTLAVFTFYFYRANYGHAKRLRTVEPGRFYRSGQLTADGFADAIRRFKIRTVINVQDDVPDPGVLNNYLDRRVSPESEVCAKLGVRYVWLAPDLVPRPQVPHRRPEVISKFLEVMDREETYPALIHCKAGLHRTGLLCAIYRMEYQGWDRLSAYRELRAHGFGEWVSTTANDYIDQYMMRFQPRNTSTRLVSR